MAAYSRLDTEVVSMVPAELPTDLIVKKKREGKNFKEELASCLATRPCGRTVLSVSLK